MHVYTMELDLNRQTLTTFLSALLEVPEMTTWVLDIGNALAGCLDQYYQRLLARHSLEGVEIHRDPVTTDIAISLFENVDSHGEIEEDGKETNQVSAYTMRKAVVLAEAMKRGLVASFVSDPTKFIEFIIGQLKHLWALATSVQETFKTQVEAAYRIAGSGATRPRPFTESDFHTACLSLKDLDPTTIVFREKTGLMSREERRDLEYRNETLRNVAELLADQSFNAKDLVLYILERKADLRQRNLEVNSFYVCRIGTGNPFSGEAPGELKVIPGVKPSANLEEILGSGFDEIREFLDTIRTSSKFYDLFVATSPSKSGDKSNGLLVGPQGCGKTQVLRGIGAQPGTIGVFAQGSDFLTCWKGEAEKNPKRFFEAGLKLQKDSGKQVFFLVDEIDTILNGDRGHEAFGGINLATEFQILMDGVVQYPHLSLWGCTNHLDRIPPPLLRRFSKVLLVGELSQVDRVNLLKQFVGFMPYEGFDEADWNHAARKLEGAVGDVVRKVVDHLWRAKMTAFVKGHPTVAENMLKSLAPKGEKFDLLTFDAKRRRDFHEVLRHHVVVRPSDLLKSVDLHLNNPAILLDIEVSKRTYENARKTLSILRQEDLN
jgi:hypothetical protein